MNKRKDLSIGETKHYYNTRNLVKSIYFVKRGDNATIRIYSARYSVNGIRKDDIRYTYYKSGNIKVVKENGKIVSRYQYDRLNRLVREDNVNFGTISYKYDAAGNILSKIIYKYTLSDTPCEEKETVKYEYNQHGGKNQLVSFCDESCKYDIDGNPVVYRDRKLAWHKGKLLSSGGDKFFSNYTYGADGTRTSKHAVTPMGTFDSKYVYDTGDLISEQRNGEWIYYIYDENGIAGFRFNDVTYLYRKNIHGDVTHVYKQCRYTLELKLVAQYVYDALGDCKTVVNVDDIATLNPFRYRSYYFDEDTGLYYFKSRYYDYETGRFISSCKADRFSYQTFCAQNEYVYCNNNPVKELGIVSEIVCNDNYWYKYCIMQNSLNELRFRQSADNNFYVSD